MKKGIINILIITMLVSIGLVSCKNEVQAPDDYLVSVSFENGSSRMLSSNLEGFEPGSYFWKYAAKKADASNLLSGQTANYDNDGREAGAQWIAEGQPGFGTIIGEVITPFRVQGFSQGLWNFTLYGYKWTDLNEDDVKDPNEFNLVYSGEITSVLLKQGGPNHVRAVVSPAQGGTGTLLVKISGMDAIYLDRAFPVAEAANTKIRLKVELVGSSGDPLFNGFVTEDYIAPLESGAYKVTVEFTNDDGEIVYAAGSVVSTVYSNLTTTIKGNLTEIITSADFGADQNPDIITTTIGTASITQGTTDSSVTFTSTSTTVTKVTASMPTSAAKSLIEKMEQALDAKTSTPESETSDLTLNLSVNTTEATETTITYEIGMEATLIYEKKDAQASQKTTTKSTVETLDDFVTVQIELQRGLTDVRVKHVDDYMTACESLVDLNSKVIPGPEASEEVKAEARKGYYFYQDPYIENNVPSTTKSMLYIRTYKFSPFQLSYTIPEPVAAIGSKTYTSLATAVAALNDGDTLTLLSDLDFSSDEYSAYKWGSTYNPLTITHNNITIDLNGKTIENMGNCAIVFGNILAVNGRICNATIKNGTLKAGKTDNVTNSYVLGIAGADGALIENIITVGGINVFTGSTDVVIKDCVVNGTKYYTVCAQCGSDVTIKGTTYTKNTDATVANKAMFWIANAGSDSDCVTTENPSGEFGASSITIENGAFTVDTANGGTFYLASGLAPVVKGGTYNIDPTAYVAEGYAAYSIGESLWTVLPSGVVYNKTDNVYYSLASSGDNKGLLIDTTTGNKVYPDKTDELILQFSFLSDLVSETIDNFNSGYNWSAIHSDTEPDYGQQYFAGGWGTRIEPYLIANLNHWNSFYQIVYDWKGEERPYFKLIADVDCRGKEIKNYAYKSNNDKVYGYFMEFALNGDNHKIIGIEDLAGYCQLFPYIWNALVCNITIDYNLNETRTAAMVYYPVGDNYFTNVTTTGSIETTADWATAYVAYMYKAYTNRACNVYYTNCKNYANIKGSYGNYGYTAVFGSHNGGGGHVTFDRCENYGGLLGGYVGFVGMGNDSAYTFVDSDAVKNFGSMSGTKNAGYFNYDSTADSKTIGGVTCEVKQTGSSAQKSTIHSDAAPTNFGDPITINEVQGATIYEVQMGISIQAYNYDDGQNANRWSGGFPRSITRTYTESDVVNGKITTEFYKGYVGEVKANEYYGKGETHPAYTDGVFVYDDFDIDNVHILLETSDLYLVEDDGEIFYVMYSKDNHGWYALLTTNSLGVVTLTSISVSFSVTAYNPDGSVLSFSSFNYGSGVDAAKEYFDNFDTSCIEI